MSRAHTRAATVLFSLFVVTTSFAGGVGATTETDTATLTVTVVDQSGNPLSDATLSATWEGGGPVNATTAGNGKAFLDVAEGADVTIRVDHQHYVRNHPYIVENATAESVTIDVALEGQATVTVEDGNGAVDNAIVRMFHDGRPVINARTSPDGTFTTGDIEQGEYSLITFKEGYLRNKTTLNVDGSVSQRMAIEPNSVEVTFSVTDDHFDPPRSVSGAKVTIPGTGNLTTQESGRVTVGIPVNDNYEIDITKRGYGSVTRELSVRESPTSLNATIQRTPSMSASVGSDRILVGERVRVAVTDEYDTPVTGASVTRNGETVGETDENGVINVPIDSTGNATIAVEGDRRETSVTVRGVEAAPDETPTATPTATPTESPSSIGPGFGGAATLVALLVAGLFAHRRRE